MGFKVRFMSLSKLLFHSQFCLYFRGFVVKYDPDMFLTGEVSAVPIKSNV